MSDIKNTFACKNKKFDSFSLTDNIGNSYLYVRTGKNWYNVAKCEVCTDGHIDDNDGLVTDAIPVHAEEVAYLVAESEARKEQLLAEEGIDPIPGVYNEHKSYEYQTYDFDIVYRSTFTKTVESFGAEHGRTMNNRYLVFDPDKLVKVGKQFDMQVTIVKNNDSNDSISSISVISAVMPSYGDSQPVIPTEKPLKDSNDDMKNKECPNDGMTGTLPGALHNAVIDTKEDEPKEWLLEK